MRREKRATKNDEKLLIFCLWICINGDEHCTHAEINFQIITDELMNL